MVWSRRGGLRAWWLLGPLLALLMAACQGQKPLPRATPSSSPGAVAVETIAPAPGLTPSPEISPSEGLTPAVVVRVVDGDTIDVRINGEEFRVRYIGIDTPETVDPRRPVECFGREASRRNRELVEGKTVGLEKDVSETDRYGRLLRYVWVDGVMVNATLVEEGYATAVLYPPDVRYADLFIRLEAEAREAGRGLWGSACATPAAPSGARPGFPDALG